VAGGTATYNKGDFMAHQALARKWRPKSFEQMVGQQHVLRALTNALQSQRLHHAYLFTGTRGVGKTTLARILAKCLNCDTGITATPCDTCPSCVSITSGRCLDVIEIDAASHSSVEDTREILDNVQYAPSQCRFKVYIIDEVHMLSRHSFNSLLKTLEEPPAHVKFLLATTDPQKLPVTVLSRCLQFHLKNMLPDQISGHLQHILAAEQIPAEREALQALAIAANGSLRDALSLLDQAIAHGNLAITALGVADMLGSVARTQLYGLLDVLVAHDANLLLPQLQQLDEFTSDYPQALQSLLLLLHDLALLQQIPSYEIADKASLQPYVTQLSAEDIQLFYQIGLAGQRDLPLAPTPRSGFEMVLLRMLCFKPRAVRITEVPSMAVGPLPSPLPEGEGDVGRQAGVQPPAAASAAVGPLPTLPGGEGDVGRQAGVQPPAAASAAVGPLPTLPGGEGNVRYDWAELLPKLQHLTGMSLMAAQHCVLVQSENLPWILQIDPGQFALVNPGVEQRIGESLSEHLQQPIQVKIQAGPKGLRTPATEQSEYQAQQQQARKKQLTEDPKVSMIINQFDAVIVE
jgi:DNA polymerase-3 subunit gamma/tau